MILDIMLYLLIINFIMNILLSYKQKVIMINYHISRFLKLSRLNLEKIKFILNVFNINVFK